MNALRTTNTAHPIKHNINTTHSGRCWGEKCWVCHPSLRPTCSKCKESGNPRFHHIIGKSKFCRSQETVSRVVEAVADTGATSHFFTNTTSIKNYRNFPIPHTITTANGSTTPAIGAGEMTILTSSGTPLTISNIKVCPGMTQNLLSIPKITDNNSYVVFTKSGCTIFDSNTNQPLKHQLTNQQRSENCRLIHYQIEHCRL
jgi:hypothetical protein